VGSPLFHYGTFAAIAGHVIGILITASVPETVGISEPTYRWFSAVAGSVAAVLAIGGIVVLAGRRLLIPRARATTSAVDYVALILLLVVVLTGIAPTIGVNLFGGGYDYRQTVAPWFRGLFTGQPDVHAIAAAPIIYQVHATAAG
jgi:nitrate reductase gamma subunit